MVRLHLTVKGIVQGVGFRPFVHLLAERLELAGWVLNSPAGVEIEVEGERAPQFLEELQRHPPILAVVERVEVEELPPLGLEGFAIRESLHEEEPVTLIPPDVAVCPDCLREMNDPADRRYRYPFLNCTNCGPRFTIIEHLPYDRRQTAMKSFPLCPDFAREYGDIHDRRYHAQPVACPRCGPQLELIEGDRHWEREEAMVRARQLLQEGKILAVKGLGGFHLACDATNEGAVCELRRRKGRPAKSMAVMVPSIVEARTVAEVSQSAENLLESWQRPIVLLPRKGNALAPSLAPDTGRIGLMLPYTPLHHLLLPGFRALVMTSANEPEEPLVATNAEAQEMLGGIADAILQHDRPIVQRLDDSVLASTDCGSMSRPLMVRRARGYAPGPFRLPRPFPSLLATGSELKNTFCLSKGETLFLSHHIGDLMNWETYQHFQRSIAHLEELYALQPEVVAYDLHPQYLATRYALSLPVARKIGVQHHHAHIAAVLFEAQDRGPVIGVACDGTGYGEDGAIWGMEFFSSTQGSSERLGQLAYVPMLGNEEAVRQPWRMAASQLFRALGEEAFPLLETLFPSFPASQWGILYRQWCSGFNAPLTSSAGRLFDAASALLGFNGRTTYEGQAAVRLEGLAGDASIATPLELPATSTIPFQLDPGPLLVELARRVLHGADRPALALGFHRSVSRAMLEGCRTIRAQRGLETVVLSGGVFQNMLLLEDLERLLRVDGFRLLLPSKLPLNDGGVSVGQAATAFARLEEEARCV
jgi:hydrogenase maturation protein HypF